MTITLAADPELLIQNQVGSGRYESTDHVIRDALRLLMERERFSALEGAQVDHRIAAGLASLRRGEGVDGDAVFDRLEAELDEGPVGRSA